jgi:hypothetical protein
MKRRLAFYLLSACILLAITSPVSANPLDEVSAWYCTLSGKDKGALKISFQGDSISGIGATAAAGVVPSFTGTYALDPATNRVTGNYQLTGDFAGHAGSILGTVSKKGTSFTFKLLSDTGQKYQIKGTLSPANVMVTGLFRDCSVKGSDKGDYDIEPIDSGMDDMFHLAGSGETAGFGRATIDLYGYGDEKGNIYGRWQVVGELASNQGPFRGKWKNGKLSIKAQDLTTDTVFSIKGADGTFEDVLLNVPFEPNRGSTCASSSFTMVLKYLGQPITFDHVFAIFGLPPFYPAHWMRFENWVEEDLDLQMETYAPCTIDHIMSCIDYGYPVVVLQHFSNPEGHDDGHDRVVIGYNIGTKELILNDPSEYGPGYRMSFDLFDDLWNYNGYGETYLMYLIFPKGAENPLSALPPYVWY